MQGGISWAAALAEPMVIAGAAGKTSSQQPRKQIAEGERGKAN